MRKPSQRPSAKPTGTSSPSPSGKMSIRLAARYTFSTWERPASTSAIDWPETTATSGWRSSSSTTRAT